MLHRLAKDNKINRPSESSMVDIWISSHIMKPPSHKCYMTFWDKTIRIDTLHWSAITSICALITELVLITDFDLITKFWEVLILLERETIGTSYINVTAWLYTKHDSNR